MQQKEEEEHVWPVLSDDHVSTQLTVSKCPTQISTSRD